MAVYSYFGAAVIGAQWVIPDNEQAYKVSHFFTPIRYFKSLNLIQQLFSQQAYSLPVGDTKAKLDLFYPFFLTIQFAFFFGWLKVTSLFKILGIPSLNPHISINDE